MNDSHNSHRPNKSDAAEMARIAKFMGKALRAHRVRAGLSLELLASAAGISYQQVQKYETGANRIPGPRLQTLCQILRVSHGQFYPAFSSDELDEDGFSNRRHTRRVTQLIEGFVNADYEVQSAVLTLLKSRKISGKKRFQQIETNT